MHINDETLSALGYACPEWDDVCEHHARLTRGEAMKRDRDRYQTRRLDLWYVERCRERAHDSREVARVEQESERLYVQPPLPGFDLTPQKRARESTYGTCVATRCEGAEHDSAQLQLFGEVG